MAVALGTIGWANTLIVQIYTTVFGSLLMLKFYIDWLPMDSLHQNKLEIFNEGFTLLTNYLMIIFTDFVTVEERYDLGFLAIYLILIVCSLNIAGVLYNLLLALRIEYYRKKYRKAWQEYHKINDKMVEFIIWDYIKEKKV